MKLQKLSVIFVLALLSAGCNKFESFDQQERSEGIDEFYASFYSEETKVDWNGADTTESIQLSWTKNDSISVFCSTTYNHKYLFNGEGSRYGTFSKVQPKDFYTDWEIPTNYAIYPYNAVSSYCEDGKFFTYFPTNQKFDNGWYNMMVAVTETPEDRHLVFKNVCGFLRIQLKGDEVLNTQSVYIQGNNSEILSGSCYIKATADGDPELTMLMLPGNGKIYQKVCISDGAAYYDSDMVITWDVLFAIPPVTFTNGFTLTAVSDDGRIFTKTVTESKTIERNVVHRMDPLEVVFEGPSTFLEFEDPDVKAYVVSQYDVDNDGEISSMEADNIDCLDLTDICVSSFEGIESIPNLKSIVINRIQGDELNLTGLDNIKVVEICSDTNIRTIDCSGMENLRTFSYFGPCVDWRPTGGTVESVNLSGCTSLVNVFCDESEVLSSINVTGCTALQTLEAYWNNLSSIDLSDNVNLTRAYLTGNPLTSVDFSKNINLEWAALLSTDITSLDISENTKLNTLYSPTENITGSGDSLEYLCVGVTSSSYTVPFANLTYLSLWGQEDGSVDVYDLSACSKLENFCTSYREVKHIVFGASASSIKTLTINNISGFEDALDFSSFNSLESLDCSGGTLDQLDVSTCTSLSKLYCQDSPELTEIWLKTGQVIKDFKYDKTVSLKYKD